MKYRIIENGHGRFYIQEKYGFFGKWDTPDYIFSNRMDNLFSNGFLSFDAAVETINEKFDLDEKILKNELDSRKIAKTWSIESIRKPKK